jgi:hypothetical protein
MSQKVKNKTFALAKEKGFIPKKEMVTRYFERYYVDAHGNNTNDSYTETKLVEEEVIPTQYDIQKWLREQHFIFVTVDLDCVSNYFKKDNTKYSPMFYTYSETKGRFWMYNDFIMSDECTDEMQETMPIFQSYKTYEEAFEIGLEEVLKLN